MTTEDSLLTIQQAAETTGLSVYTLRYYERIGLIDPIERAENTHRRYRTQDLSWIEFLNKLRCAGMSIQQMKAYAELQRQGDETLPQRLEMLTTHRLKVQAHMDELCEHLNLIDYKIEVYQEIISTKLPEKP